MRWIASLVLIIILSGCAAPPPTAEVPPTLNPATPTAFRGQLTPLTGQESISGRRIALCEVSGDLSTCTITGVVGSTAADGRFVFRAITPAAYLLLIDTGFGDFQAAIEAWRGRTLITGDWAWQRDNLFAGAQTVNLNLPPLPTDVRVDPAEYAVQTFQLGESPFMLAHQFQQVEGQTVVRPVVVDLTREAGLVEIPVTQPQPVDLDAARALGPLSTDEQRIVTAAFAERWAQFIAGDDTAFRDTDIRLIDALRGGLIFEIGSTLLTTQELEGQQLVKRVAYITNDRGQIRVVGWYSPRHNDIIEADTGYRLNVRDGTGEWTTTGPNGEQFYHYGWSWTARWQRLLPDPVISMMGNFYNNAPAHVAQFLPDYQNASIEYGRDLRLLTWSAGLTETIRDYVPSTTLAPTLYLPDSGTVDIRRERFLEAMISGQVVVDEDSIDDFLAMAIAQNNPYIFRPDPQDVKDALLTPYRSGHLYNDMEAAIILHATYLNDEPLVVQINPRLRAGFQVPRRDNRVVRISPNEVANVSLGYGGTLTAKWPHELSHILEFGSDQYEWRRQQDGLSACEPLKYMLEFMWWVERYPYDAPDTDWMPIGSGLTLARLLTDTYPNSGC